MPSRPRLLRAGDLVRFDGRLHAVAALEGTAVRLVDENQSPSVVLLAHLLSSAGFEVVTPSSVRAAVPAAGVLSLKAVERAEWWQRHLVEMLTGRPMEDPHGRVRAAYDPAVRSLRQREQTQGAELEAGGHRALPGSAGRERRWACRRCAAAHAPGQRIALFAPAHHHHVCLRHGLWVGKAAHRPQDQIDLAQLPGTVRAQRWHRRLLRRYGADLTTQCLHAARGF